MLKFLTHKLKTHSLNEGALQKVEDEDHDSGTESDDEHGTGEEPEISMESEGGSSIVTGSSRSGGSVAASPYFLDSALPSDCDQGYDQHSSEEELEVINCTQPKINTGQEKRKWSQVTTPESVVGLGAAGSGSRGCRRWGEAEAEAEAGAAPRAALPWSSSPSSEEEVCLAAKVTAEPPLQFRTSPPRGTHRPCTEQQFIVQEASPRKRHRHAAPPRPCLNFEKMQQMKARAVTAWRRHAGDTGNELSVYCW